MLVRKEQPELTYISGGKAKWYYHLGKPGNFLQFKYTCVMCHMTHPSHVYRREMKTCLRKTLHSNVH